MKLRNLQRQLSELDTELNDVYSMSEEAACFRYNVDCKEDAINLLEDEIDCITAQIEDCECEQGGAEPFFGDIAFPTEQSYYSFRF